MLTTQYEREGQFNPGKTYFFLRSISISFGCDFDTKPLESLLILFFETLRCGLPIPVKVFNIFAMQIDVSKRSVLHPNTSSSNGKFCFHSLFIGNCNQI
jgi:hypothetical protein